MSRKYVRIFYIHKTSPSPEKELYNFCLIHLSPARVNSHKCLGINLLATCGRQNMVWYLYRHRVHRQWQWPLTGVHSFMMEKSAEPGEGRGARPPPFTLSTITSKVVVYAPAVRADTLPYFYSTPLYTLCL